MLMSDIKHIVHLMSSFTKNMMKYEIRKNVFVTIITVKLSICLTYYLFLKSLYERLTTYITVTEILEISCFLTAVKCNISIFVTKVTLQL